MSEIKGIIFDMDGVILDSESISDITWDRAAKDFNITMTSEILNSCRGSNKNDILARLHTIYGNNFNADDFLDKTGEYFTEIENKDGIPLMPFAKEILEYLQPKYKLALASSTKGPTVERQLTAAGVIKYFEKRITGEMVEHSKPNPEIYLRACKAAGLEPDECAAVEDSLNGVRSASAAGLKTIMVPDKVQPTKEIAALCWKICRNLEELKTIL